MATSLTAMLQKSPFASEKNLSQDVKTQQALTEARNVKENTQVQILVWSLWSLFGGLFVFCFFGGGGGGSSGVVVVVIVVVVVVAAAAAAQRGMFCPRICYIALHLAQKEGRIQCRDWHERSAAISAVSPVPPSNVPSSTSFSDVPPLSDGIPMRDSRLFLKWHPKGFFRVPHLNLILTWYFVH